MVALKFFKVANIPLIADAEANAVYFVKGSGGAISHIYITDNKKTKFYQAIHRNGNVITTESIDTLRPVETNNIPFNTTAIVHGESENTCGIYRLIYSTASENVPYTLSPNDFDVATNPRLWALQPTYPHIPGSYSNDTAAEAAGVPVGFPYHNAGEVRVRLV